MTAFKWFGCVSTLMLALPVLLAEPHCPGNVPSLHLRTVHRPAIVVPVEINRSGPCNFLVDTGAQITQVNWLAGGPV